MNVVWFFCASVRSNANNEISRLTCWCWQVCNLLFAINFLSSSKNLLDPVWYVLIIMIIVALIQNCNLLLLWSILVVLRYFNWSVKFRLFAVFFCSLECNVNWTCYSFRYYFRSEFECLCQKTLGFSHMKMVFGSNDGLSERLLRFNNFFLPNFCLSSSPTSSLNGDSG